MLLHRCRPVGTELLNKPFTYYFVVLASFHSLAAHCKLSALSLSLALPIVSLPSCPTVFLFFLLIRLASSWIFLSSNVASELRRSSVGEVTLS